MSDNNQEVAVPATPNTTVGVQPGWYNDHVDPPHILRWWDGHMWTNQRTDTTVLNTATPNIIGNSAPVQQVLIQQDRKRVNHLLHLVLTIFTFGLWLPVWIVLAFAKS